MGTVISVSIQGAIIGNVINNELARTGTEVKILDMLQNVALGKFDIIRSFYKEGHSRWQHVYHGKFFKILTFGVDFKQWVSPLVYRN